MREKALSKDVRLTYSAALLSPHRTSNHQFGRLTKQWLAPRRPSPEGSGAILITDNQRGFALNCDGASE